MIRGESDVHGDRHGSTTEDFTPSFFFFGGGGTGMPSIPKNIDIEDQQILQNSHRWEGNTPYPSVCLLIGRYTFLANTSSSGTTLW